MLFFTMRNTFKMDVFFYLAHSNNGREGANTGISLLLTDDDRPVILYDRKNLMDI
jgi:hypothetical protein